MRHGDAFCGLDCIGVWVVGVCGGLDVETNQMSRTLMIPKKW
jgi:hypothetical protein